MTANTNPGHVVWHDLLTNDVAKARKFYGELLGWAYEVEHATDFVWKSGEADYPLIMVDGQAHGGFVEIGAGETPRWLAFVSVADVNATTDKAKVHNASVQKPPFDVPGVGRSSVICDAQGAMICPYVASHDYPPPSGVFIWDELLTERPDETAAFYSMLFDWTYKTTHVGALGDYVSYAAKDGTPVAGGMRFQSGKTALAQWVPYIAVSDVDATVTLAKSLGGHVVMPATSIEHVGHSALLEDPTGAMFGILLRRGHIRGC